MSKHIDVSYIHVYVWFKDEKACHLNVNMIDTKKISACSTEYEVCDSFAVLTRQQTSYSGSTG